MQDGSVICFLVFGDYTEKGVFIMRSIRHPGGRTPLSAGWRRSASASYIEECCKKLAARQQKEAAAKAASSQKK